MLVRINVLKNQCSQELMLARVAMPVKGLKSDKPVKEFKIQTHIIIY